jgi:YVTN family beta-propeller protein
LYEIVFNPTDQRVYVAAAGPRGGKEAKIIALDPQSLAPVNAIDRSGEAGYGLALNVSTQTLYTTNTIANSVSAIDVRSGSVLATIRNGENKAHLRQIVIDEETDTVYATVFGGMSRDPNAVPPKSEIWVIDGKTKALAHIISDPGISVTGLALDAKAKRLYVTDLATSHIIVLDTSTRHVMHRWPAGGAGAAPIKGLINVAVDTETRRLYAVNQDTGTLAVMNADDGTLIKTISTGEGALSVRVHPKSKQIFVANRRAGTVSVVDATSYEIVATLKTGTHPQTIAIDVVSNRVYVTNKARGRPRDAPRDAPVPDDPDGDTVTIIVP